MADTLEAAMLLSFSASWYWSIAKMLRTGQAAGKSARFVALICAGYVCGMAAQLVEWRDAGQLSPLIYLYAWNLLVTLTDLALVLHLTRRRAIP